MVSDDDSFHIIKRVELKNKRGEAEKKSSTSHQTDYAFLRLDLRTNVNSTAMIASTPVTTKAMKYDPVADTIGPATNAPVIPAIPYAVNITP